jgi:riboflavin kinase / FMN adenylyltransferase
MQCFTGYISAQKYLQKSVVTIGNFDGLHLGHQELIKQTKIMAERFKTRATVYTFSPHPSRLLWRNPQKMLMTDQQKKQGLAQLGIDAVIFEPFTPAFSSVSAEDFLQRILVEGLKVSGVVVGKNFNFGHKGTGNAAMLQNHLLSQDIAVEIVSPVFVEKQLCSSTTLRELILSEQLDAAAALLGRFYTLAGVVVPGDGRGKSIGFASATLQTKQELLPTTGVYATFVKLSDVQKPMLGATNIGYRPTFKDDYQLHIETHILDFEQSIYGKPIELAFIRKIRDEITFNSSGELKSQIEKDLLKVRQLASIYQD